MIKASIIADSEHYLTKQRLTTFELEYPRFIHSELMTHRLFSRNAASSRAIPIETMMKQVLENPAMPVQWGLNQSGMQAGEDHKHPATCVWAWRQAAERAVVSARELQALGLHKQIVNRVLEPFQMMKTIVTATEYDNFFWLRCHEDAQPEIKFLAELMYENYTTNEAIVTLEPGQWHVPYYKFGYWIEGLDETLEEAQKISASCCAQVSYRKLDESLEKALKVYDRLVSMEPVHASPLEHIATPMKKPHFDEEDCWYIEKGATHQDESGNVWSGNLKGFIQYRQLIDNNACWGYNP